MRLAASTSYIQEMLHQCRGQEDGNDLRFLHIRIPAYVADYSDIKPETMFFHQERVFFAE